MILRNGVQPTAFYRGEDAISRIYRGESIVWEAHHGRLPAGYQEVEWIRSEGSTQYILTGFVADYNSALEVDFAVYLVANTYIAGSINGSSAFNLYIFRARYDGVRRMIGTFINSNGASYIPCEIENLGTRTKILVSKDGVYQDGVLMGVPTGYIEGLTNARQIALFGGGNGTSLVSSISDAKIYNAKLYDNSTLARNYIPCYRKSDGEIGMYDLCGSICSLTGTPFYINAGTGTFTKGADI